MKRFLTLVLLFGFICLPAFSAGEIKATVDDSGNKEVPAVKVELREADGVELPAGLVIPVINMQEISTQTCPEGYKTKFISINDIFIGDNKVIPENTAFYGYIEKINEPVIGTNASMKVKITKLVLPDGYEQYIKGYVYTSNDNLIGGELTPPSTWVKMPHYQDKFQGISWNHRAATLQIRPGGLRSMGTHTTVPAGERELIILVAPINMTHTYMDE